MDFNEFWIQQAIMAGIGAILVTIKNPNSERAKLLKASLLHLADAIYAAFPRQASAIGESTTPPQG